MYICSTCVASWQKPFVEAESRMEALIIFYTEHIWRHLKTKFNVTCRYTTWKKCLLFFFGWLLFEAQEIRTPLIELSISIGYKLSRFPPRGVLRLVHNQIKIITDWLLILKLVWLEPCYSNVTQLHFTSLNLVWSQLEASLKPVGCKFNFGVNEPLPKKKSSTWRCLVYGGHEAKQSLWHGLNHCDMASITVTWPQSLWHGLNHCDMASFGTSMLYWVLSRPTCWRVNLRRVLIRSMKSAVVSEPWLFVWT